MAYHNLLSRKDGMNPGCPLICSFFLLLIIVSGVFGEDGPKSVSDPNFLLSILWKEDRQAIPKPEDPKTLYPRERHCIAPELSEPLKAYRHEDSPWSSLFSRYTLDAGDELDVWRENQESHSDTKHEIPHITAYDLIFPIIFPICFAIFLCVCVIIIPVLGAVGFRIIEIIWYLTTHRELRRIGRRTLIMCEQMVRARNRMLLPEGVEKPPKRLFYLPAHLRLYSGEDVPVELEESEDDQEEWLTPGVEWHNERDGDDGEVGDASGITKVGVSLSGLQINEEDGRLDD